MHACRPAQFAEETRRADKTVPRAIVLSVLVCGALGFSYLLTILFCIQARAFPLLSPPGCSALHPACTLRQRHPPAPCLHLRLHAPSGLEQRLPCRQARGCTHGRRQAGAC
jgi:hypothetical protein